MNYQQERKPGNGRVWAQTKSNNPRAPQFTGELKTPDGQVWRISMWESRDRNTGQFNGFSMKAQAPQQQQNPTQPQQQDYQPQGAPQQGYQPQGQQDWQAPPMQNQNPGYQGHNVSPGGPPDVPPPNGPEDYEH